MHIETRALTEGELTMTLAAYGAAPRSGCSVCAYYGMFIVLFPTIGGGFTAQLLQLARLPDSVVFPLGLLLASVGSVALFVLDRRRSVRERTEREAAIESLMTAGCVRTYIAVAEKAWEVTDYDHGPSYLIKVESAGFIYISSFSPRIEAIGDLRRQITVSVADPVGLVLAASTEGVAISTDPPKLEPEDVTDSRGCPADFAVWSLDELPQSWRRAIESAA